NLGGDLPRMFSSGFAIEVPLIDTTRYLNYLEARLSKAGGVVQEMTPLAKLIDVSTEFDLIVNCSGIGAKELAPDSEMIPHRGQVAVVAKLDLPYAVVCDDAPLMYAIPRATDCVIGGTNHVSADLRPWPAETLRMIEEAARVLAISPPRLVQESVGLRPFRRAGVRVAREQLADGRAVIHNYGHGGAGFTLSWGCADAAVALVAN
ncbi:MAG TPA: FAD-dependent oxidoreductase, partial [Chthoniobacterales bacterium]